MSGDLKGSPTQPIRSPQNIPLLLHNSPTCMPTLPGVCHVGIPENSMRNLFQQQYPMNGTPAAVVCLAGTCPATDTMSFLTRASPSAPQNNAAQVAKYTA